MRRAPGMSTADVLRHYGVPFDAPSDDCVRPTGLAGPQKNGYWHIRFGNRTTTLHREILRFSLGDIPQGIQARHICGHKWCVNSAHIVPGTRRDNMRDQYRLGERVMNERHPNCRLSTADALAIRTAPSDVASHELAVTYEVTTSYVNQIRSGTRRRFLPNHPTRRRGKTPMSITYADALSKVGVTVPEHLIADAEVPVLTGPQAQGDLIIIPIEKTTTALAALPVEGVQVVVGEATGNSHWLHRGFDSDGVLWARVDDGTLRLAIVEVPAGQSALLIHTDEHGCNSVGPGLYAIHGKREQADEIRRVAD